MIASTDSTEVCAVVVELPSFGCKQRIRINPALGKDGGRDDFINRGCIAFALS